MLVNNLFYFVAALVTSAFTMAQDDGWHLDYVNTLANEQLDPVVSPNGQSAHMHKIIGGSRMAAYYNFDDYKSAKCSSLRVQADKSNYWMPSKSYCMSHPWALMLTYVRPLCHQQEY